MVIKSENLKKNYERQLEEVKLDEKFIDKASEKDINRPGFRELLNYVHEDDLVVVRSMNGQLRI